MARKTAEHIKLEKERDRLLAELEDASRQVDMLMTERKLAANAETVTAERLKARAYALIQPLLKLADEANREGFTLKGAWGPVSPTGRNDIITLNLVKTL